MKVGPIKLLLADDDVDDRFFFRDSLSKLSIETNLTTVTNGVELMNLLLTSKADLPDVIFLDLNMPMKSGFECLSEIMAHDKFRNLPIIIYSTSMEEPVVNSLYEQGAFHYIRKPGEYSKLKDVIFKGLCSLANKAAKPTKDNFVIQSQ
ncbi:response regulator [Algoriphagus aquimarinus]|uniref:Response regulator receiver domain-containing protein n=1 Tax=Algoriphagus aquimarinus TaxID=237018 RepID=A0A1I0WG23_9BACT|nr:response regulator [Algoriphagus aquimarinus]SFA87709.1 Response regulator receiver domain-containing protein [Algoriphagus aquimarinus]|tara:strand:- start:118660 stop:119106 length:447 start_codon:yes stop_codon:yes gene_type:complete